MTARWLAAVIATAGLLAGCSSGPPDEKPTTSSVAPANHGSLAQCLSEYGLPAAPGPADGPPPGIPDETWTEAMAACASLAPGPPA